MKPLRFTKRALQHFQEIHDYIAKDNANIALGFIKQLEKRCHSLAEMPRMGRKADIHPNFRSATEGEYIIFYRPWGKGIEIMGVIHGKRDLTKITFFD